MEESTSLGLPSFLYFFFFSASKKWKKYWNRRPKDEKIKFLNREKERLARAKTVGNVSVSQEAWMSVFKS